MIRFFFLLFLCLSTKGVAAFLTSSVPLTISSTGANVLPQVAVNSLGDAVAIWSKSSSIQIETAVFNHLTGVWSAPLIIGSGGTPQVGIDSSGNALAVWVLNNQIQFSRFSFTTKQWSLPVLITTSGFNTFPKISVSPTGQATVVWLANFPTQVLASVFDTTTLVWSTPIQVSLQSGASPVVGVRGDGNGFAVWQDYNTAAILTSTLTKH